MRLPDTPERAPVGRLLHGVPAGAWLVFGGVPLLGIAPAAAGVTLLLAVAVLLALAATSVVRRRRRMVTVTPAGVLEVVDAGRCIERIEPERVVGCWRDGRRVHLLARVVFSPDHATDASPRVGRLDLLYPTAADAARARALLGGPHADEPPPPAVRFPIVSVIAGAVMLAVHAYGLQSEHAFTFGPALPPSWSDLTAWCWPFVRSGEVHRAWSSAWSSPSMASVGVNVGVLVACACALEARKGGRYVAVVAGATHLVGLAGSAPFDDGFDSAGASILTSGFVAATVITAFRDRWTRPLRLVLGLWGAWRLVTEIVVLTSGALPLVTPVAHLLGSAAGAALAWVYGGPRASAARPPLLVAGAVALMLAPVAAVVLAARHRPEELVRAQLTTLTRHAWPTHRREAVGLSYRALRIMGREARHEFGAPCPTLGADAPVLLSEIRARAAAVLADDVHPSIRGLDREIARELLASGRDREAAVQAAGLLAALDDRRCGTDCQSTVRVAANATLGIATARLPAAALPVRWRAETASVAVASGAGRSVRVRRLDDGLDTVRVLARVPQPSGEAPCAFEVKVPAGAAVDVELGCPTGATPDVVALAYTANDAASPLPGPVLSTRRVDGAGAP